MSSTPSPGSSGTPTSGTLRVRRFGGLDRPAYRLFCFPYAGGGTAVFRRWPERLPPDVEVCAVELPGRERLLGEPPMSDLAALTARVADSMGPCLDLPFSIFGHSMGALLGFELARQLCRMVGCVPSVLFVSGHRAPQLPDSRTALHALPDEEFIAALARLRGTQPEVLNDRELLDLYLPVLRADFALSETYRFVPAAPLACSIVAFCGRDDSEVSEREMTAWGAQTTADFRLHMMEGDHFFLNSPDGAIQKAIAWELSRQPAWRGLAR